MGPLVSVYFYDLLTTMQQTQAEQDFVDVLLYSKPSTPDRTRFIAGQGGQSPFDSLLAAARVLEAAGATCLVMPCVTAHYFYDALVAQIQTPFLHIATQAVRCLQQGGITRAGVLATDGTMQSGFLTRALTQAGCEVVRPTAEAQAKLMQLIYGGYKRGEPVDREAFLALCDGLRDQGAQAVVLGCTELSLAARDWGLDDGFVDMLKLLAQAALTECGANIKCR
jgi:aspartate racemase